MLRAAPTGASTGEMAVFSILAFLAVMAGFMSTLAVVRHTRQNEETGRTEMIGAMVVGRHASLTAALIVTAVANAVLAALVALVFAGNGEPAAGSVAAGLAVGAAGVAFAAIAAVAAQIAQSSRGANGIAAAAIGAAYLVRGLGDAFGEILPNGYTMTSGWPSWLSPIGWAMRVRPFAGEQWWVLALPLALFVAGVGLAFALTVRRDVGMGLIAARPGPTRADPGLLSPLGLAWRLQRGTLLGWAIAITVYGVVIGSLGNAVEEGLGGNAGATRTINNLGGGGGAALIDTFFAAMMAIIGALVAGYLVQALLRLRAEESGGRAEAVLATGTSRLRWLGSHLVVAVAGAAVLLGLAGVSVGLVYGLSVGNIGGELAELTGAAFVQLPSVLILAGFAVAVFGLVPRLAVGLAWLGFHALPCPRAVRRPAEPARGGAGRLPVQPRTGVAGRRGRRDAARDPLRRRAGAGRGRPGLLPAAQPRLLTPSRKITRRDRLTSRPRRRPSGPAVDRVGGGSFGRFGTALTAIFTE